MTIKNYVPGEDYNPERYDKQKEEKEKLRRIYSEIKDRKLERTAKELIELLESTDIGRR
jgi:hypothetical protein